MYVLDTNVLSQRSPAETKPSQSVLDWLRRNGDYCYLSAVTITETSYGVAWLRHRGHSRRASKLAAWLDEIQRHFRDRIIPVTFEVAFRAGELLAVARANGATPSAEDAWIAASGDLNGMTVLTLNRKHFEPMGIACRDPLANPPADVVPLP